jgi:potassium-dependent mechanosensitive channel
MTSKYFIIVVFTYVLICCQSIFAEQKPFTQITAGQMALLDVDINENELEAGYKTLTLEKKANEIARHHLSRLRHDIEKKRQQINEDNITDELIEKVAIEVRQAQVNLNSIELELSNTNLTIKLLKQNIDEYKSFYHTISLESIQTDQDVFPKLETLKKLIDYKQALLNLLQERLVAITEAKRIATERLTLYQDWQSHLMQLLDAKEIKLAKKNELDEIKKMQAEEQQWLDTAAKYSETLSSLSAEELSGAKGFDVNFNAYYADTKASQIQLAILLLQLKSKIRDLPVILGEVPPSQILSVLSKRTETLLQEAMSLKNVIDGKSDTITQRKAILNSSVVKNILSTTDYNKINLQLNELQKKSDQFKEDIDKEITGLQNYRNVLDQSHRRALAVRQGFPGFHQQAWIDLAQELYQIPILTFQALKAIFIELIFSIRYADISKIFFIIGFVALWLYLGVISHHYFKKTLAKLMYKGIGHPNHVVYVFCQLMRRNVKYIFIFINLLVLLLASGLMLNSLSIFIALGSVLLAFKLALSLCKIVLFEATEDISGKDVTLYHTLRWILWFGAVCSFLTVLVHQLDLSFVMRDFFNRIFMLFLLMVGIALLKGRKVIPSVLIPYLTRAPLYLVRIIRLLSTLVPVTIIANAVIGILGYIELAMTIAEHAVLLLIVLTFYLVTKGFLIDAMEMLSRFFIRRIRNGWLWTESILKPLDRVFRLLLILFAIYILFVLYGWNGRSSIVNDIIQILHYPLFEISDSAISAYSLIELSILIAVFFWACKWVREFSYRWLFAKVEDQGVRNSLAVFSQYFVGIIGIFISLRILGIGLTGLTVVAGGLAVGIGFGLRDLANNFISGLLMLIERPAKVGDIVTSDIFEGEVVNIGMRSLTVRTWDNMDVLIPNSEVFSKPFTNWTLLDSVVRTVIEIRIARNDEPLKVQQIILALLASLDYVLNTPEPTVFLHEMNESLLEIHVRYFINIQHGLARAEVRSMVLFELCQVFDKYNIKPPYDKKDIYIKEIANE